MWQLPIGPSKPTTNRELPRGVFLLALLIHPFGPSKRATNWTLPRGVFLLAVRPIGSSRSASLPLRATPT